MSIPKTASSARSEVRQVAPRLIELTESVVYGDIWERPGLSKRDRSLITVADLNPANLVAFVLDNSSYAFMGSTFTARRTDLAKMAQGAGIAKSGTVRTLEEFSAAAKQAMETTGPHFIVAKVEADAGRVTADRSRTSGRPMREWFMDAVRRHPDYQSRR